MDTYKIIKFKNVKIETYAQKIHNGFEFAPIEICKFKIAYHNYISIKISLIKFILFIDFIWNGKK